MRTSRCIARVWVIDWRSPYTQPPDGMARRQLEVRVPYSAGMAEPPEVEAKWREPGGPGSPWCVGSSVEKTPPKPWPLERKLAYRRKRLEARMRQKFPLFVDEMVAAAVAKNREYYGG